ncbi:Unknown protein, partial [Striga hermonthica]
VNPYAKVFRRLKDYPSMDEVRLHISKDAKLNQRVYNCPTTDQVAAIWVGGNNVNIPFERDIVIHAHSGRHRIKHYFGCYDPLQYPLLFPRGDGGWHKKNFKLASDGNSTQKEGTILIFLCLVLCILYINMTFYFVFIFAEAIARLQPINDVDVKESLSKSPKSPSLLPKNQEASQKKQVQRRKRVADKMKEDTDD